MQIEVIRSEDAWSALAAEWGQLVQHTHQNTPFQLYAFQRAWWQHLGGGEWKDVQLYILTGRSDEGELLGIAPLFRAGDTLHFIGTHEIADFLDFIARPADLPEFIEAVLAYLATQDDWQILDLYNLLDSSASLSLLGDISQKQNWSFTQETLQPSPYLPIPDDLDAYIDRLDSKQAHELRRKLRRAAKNPQPISLEIISDAAALPAALDDFFTLMTQEADKARFLTKPMRTQMDTSVHAAFADGWLQLAFLKIGTVRAAGYLNFDYDGCVWGYNAGFNNAYASLSPGWLIMAELVRWCAAHGRKIFDFMRGGEDYKYRFGAVDRFVERVTIKK